MGGKDDDFWKTEYFDDKVRERIEASKNAFDEGTIRSELTPEWKAELQGMAAVWRGFRDVEGDAPDAIPAYENHMNSI